MKRLALAFLCSFFVLVSLPELLTRVHWLQPIRLRGAVPPTKEIPLRFESYASGAFQSAFEGRYGAEFAVRGHLVRTQNETNLRVFHQLDQHSNTPMLLGKNDFLYEGEYVDAYNRRDHVPLAELETKVRRLRLLQDHLERNGSTLLVVISPSKAHLYPEFLPAGMRDKRFPDVPTNYAAFIPLLEEHGVHFLDAQGYLEQQKRKVDYLLFANTGAHWNRAASCPVVDRIMRTLGKQLGREFSGVSCKPVRVRPEPEPGEHDLSTVANLWFESALFQPTPYPDARPKVAKGGDQPSLLIVGGSFVWALLHDFERFKLTRSVDYLYYYSRWVHSPGGKRTPLERDQLDFEHDVFRHDAVVIEINASLVQKVGFGILEDAELAIQRSAAPGATR